MQRSHHHSFISVSTIPALLVLTALLAAGCANLPGTREAGTESAAEGVRAEEERSPGTAREEKQPVPSVAFSPLTGRRALAEELGEPVSAEREETENRHDPAVVDTVHHWHYPGISFTVRESGYDGREFLLAVQITGERWYLPGGVSVGSTRNDLLDSFGQSTRVEETRVYYEGSAGGEGSGVRYLFIFEGERIARIEISAFPL